MKTFYAFLVDGEDDLVWVCEDCEEPDGEYMDKDMDDTATRTCDICGA